jgi:hypothetical protein
MNPTRKYLLILSLFFACVPAVGLLNYTFLRNSYEFEHVENVVTMQLQNGALYLSALHQTVYPYKQALYRKIKPKIVALGSSRVNRIRGRYFNVPFVNLGASMYSFIQGENILREMLATHKPDIVLLGLDHSWFCMGPSETIENTTTGTEFQIDMCYLPCQWLIEGKVSFTNFCKILMGRNLNPFMSLGMLAAIRGEGFYSDGSEYDYGRVFGFYKRSGSGFSKEREQIGRGEGLFKYDLAINPERWAEFVSLMEFAKSQNIQVITLLLPLPARVIDWMSEVEENYAYLDELRAKIPEASAHHYDLFDPREFGSSDCEFFDGVHSGEITDVRMLRKIGQDPASGLGPYLNWARIEEVIDQYKGKTMVPIHSYGPQYKEIDFLKLGCKKN